MTVILSYGSATASGVPPVARMQPASTSAKPITMPTVSRSFRSVTPSAAATAGFTYVITVARSGPTSLISAKKIRNAAAEQTTARPTTDSTTCADGNVEGQFAAASGA